MKSNWIDKSSRATGLESRAIFEMALDGMLIIDDAKRIIDANPAGCEILGYTRDEMAALDIDEIVAPGRCEEVPALWQQFMREGALAGEFSLRRKDGTIIEVEFRAVARIQTNLHLCVLHDITGRIAAEAALRRSEERFAAFMDHLPGYAWIKDRDGIYMYGNRALDQLPECQTGYLGKIDTDIWGPEIAALYRAHDRKVIEDKKTLVTVDPYLKEGRTRNALATKFPIFDGNGEVAMVGGVSVDITERVEAEEALLERERRHRQLVEALPAAVYTCDTQGRITHYNEAAQKMWGRTPDLEKDLWCGSFRVVEMDGRQLLLDECPMAIAVREGRTPSNHPLIIERPDGSRSIVLPHPAPIFDATGAVTGGVNMVVDLTDQRKNEERICQSEARLAAAEAIAHLGYWERDLATNRVIWSDERYRMMGLRPQEQEATYELFLKSVHPDDRRRVEEAVQGVLLHKQPATYTYRVVLAAESVRLQESRATLMTDSEGRAIRMFGVTQDITERERTGEALKRANEHLHVLSKRLFQVQEEEQRHLSRELHDQIGQALTVVNINLREARHLEMDSAVARRLDAGISLLDEVTEKVRTISLRLRPPLLDDLGLVSAVRSYLDLQSQLGGFLLEFYANPALGRVGQETETTCFRIIQEAVTNVLRHANADRLNVELQRTEDVLHLIVRDNGVGFNVDFPRAGAKDGVGLGILGMRERVAILGGQFDIRSNPGEGAEIHVFLPISRP